MHQTILFKELLKIVDGSVLEEELNNISKDILSLFDISKLTLKWSESQTKKIFQNFKSLKEKVMALLQEKTRIKKMVMEKLIEGVPIDKLNPQIIAEMKSLNPKLGGLFKVKL